MRSRLEAAAFLTTIAIFATLLPGPSEATPRLCRQLEAELASAGQGGSSPRVQQYEEAIARQREQIVIARSQAHEAGCGFALRGGSIRQCARINATLERMERNLEVLQRNRSRISGHDDRSETQIFAALEANGCRDEERIAERPPEEFPTTSALPETYPPSDWIPDEVLDGADRDDALLPDSETEPTFRTMCVRTCDGFFFPMSNTASMGDFERDQKNCEAACPGTEVRLFFGQSGSHDASDMTSTSTGRPYSELPTAFLHQKTSSPRPASCGCGAKKDFEVIAGTKRPTELTRRPLDPPTESAESPVVPNQQSPAPTQTQSSIVTVPAPEPTPSTNKPAQKTTTPAGTKRSSASDSSEKPVGRRVRVVGPAFLPDQ
ncbi:DUF2865 domain-containing protein [Pseudaminobacter sp. 19-2017]|uniref:DUF2865 domain-containing protein n=1 Tax=Pseudaminobacter soli (ex Zhang et al. 2022) TaxID=2831468 RepID=A0A942DUS5_9HYPH|nr:DUF2865 domain-containing protein [Pseudaminobacter soli]MBS3647024.1 DUF2865 domain-containing protein [Pseudaminobacter soli]